MNSQSSMLECVWGGGMENFKTLNKKQYRKEFI